MKILEVIVLKSTNDIGIVDAGNEMKRWRVVPFQFEDLFKLNGPNVTSTWTITSRKIIILIMQSQY